MYTMAIIADDAAIRTQYFVSADVVSLLVSTFALPILVLWAWQRWPKGGKDGLTVATALCLLVCRSGKWGNVVLSETANSCFSSATRRRFCIRSW